MTRDHQKPYNLGIDQAYKRGILFTDDFENTSIYETSGTGADWQVANHSMGKYNRELGLVMKTRITSPAPSDYCRIEKQISYPQTNRIVLSSRVGIPYPTSMKLIYSIIDIWDGSDRKQAVLRYQPFGKTMHYQSSTGSFVLIEGYGQTIEDNFWTIFEYAVDLSLTEYIYVLFNGIRTDLRSKQFQIVSGTVDRKVEIRFDIQTQDSVLTKMYLDSLYAGEFEKL